MADTTFSALRSTLEVVLRPYLFVEVCEREKSQLQTREGRA